MITAIGHKLGSIVTQKASPWEPPAVFQTNKDLARQGQTMYDMLTAFHFEKNARADIEDFEILKREKDIVAIRTFFFSKRFFGNIYDYLLDSSKENDSQFMVQMRRNSLGGLPGIAIFRILLTDLICKIENHYLEASDDLTSQRIEDCYLK